MADNFKRVKVPKAIAGMLYGDEIVYGSVKQSRWKRLLRPTAFCHQSPHYSHCPKAWDCERL